jgi:antitoxin component YwqK of YwqJK toxin-antitoxin module
MKNFLLLLLLATVSAAAQNHNLPSYPVFFNNEFNVCEKEEALFSGTAFVTGKLTEVVVYHANGEKAYTGVYKDKLLTVRNGMFTWYDTSGIKIRLCNYENNIMQGLAVSWYGSGKMQDSGYYRNGYPDAAWKYWYPSGSLKTIISFSAKKLAGFKETYAARPSVQQPTSSYEIFTSSATPMPSLSYGTNDAAKIYKYAKANKYNLVATSALDVDKYVNVRAGERAFNDRAFSNRSGKRNENTRLTENTDAMADGLYMRFFENGMAKDSGYFKDGLRAGIWKSWGETGHLATLGKYEDSRRSGEWKFYDENGRLQYIRHFKWNGMLASEITMK